MEPSRLRVILLTVTVILLGSGIGRGEDAPKLTKDDGPYLVLASSFRGDRAEEQAQKLATELKNDYKIPSYVHFQAKEDHQVYVGNCKTNREAFELMNRVKKIEPNSLSTGSSFRKKQGLSRAIVRTNPLVKDK